MSNTYIENFECHVFPGCACGEHWLEHWSQPIQSGLYAGGRIEHYYDITRRKRVEEALHQIQKEELQKSEARFRTIVEDQTELICRFLPDGILTFVNEAYCRYFDKSRQELIGCNFMTLIPEEDRSKTKQMLASFDQANPVATHEHRVIRSIAEVHWQQWTNRAIFNEQGQVIEYQAVGRDITQRKQVIEALEKSEKQYRTLFEHSPISLWEEDFSAVKMYLDKLQAEGVKDLRVYFEHHPEIVTQCAAMVKVVDVNQASVELFQAESKEKLLGSLSQIFVKGTHDAFNEELVAIAEGRTEFEDKNISRVLRSQTLRGDRKYTTLKWSVAPGYEETFSKVLVSVIDITAHKLIETEKVRLFEAIEQQHQQLRALTGQLAEAQEIERKQLAQELHDQVGQNLTALDFNLNLIRAQISGILPKNNPVYNRLDDSLALLDQTAECIRDVMAHLRPPMLDDHGLVATLRWYAAQFATRMGLIITVQGEEPAPRLAPPVEHALFRITQEALTNAAKHAQATRVIVRVEIDNNMVRLIVGDDGLGFEPMRLAGRQGWGLISMVERAEAVGGRCHIESYPEQGTRIIMEVPR